MGVMVIGKSWGWGVGVGTVIVINVLVLGWWWLPLSLSNAELGGWHHCWGGGLWMVIVSGALTG